MPLKVIVTTNESTAREIVLCDSPDPLPTFNIALNGQGILDRQDLFGAAYGGLKNLGGWRNTLSFRCTRVIDGNGTVFANSLKALRFAFQHQSDVKNISLAKFVLSDGGETDTWYLKNAQVERVEMPKVVNSMLQYGYTITGGELANTI